MPFLSIIIANYNYGRFLPDALDSVLSQSCQDFELIIIDGGSTDDSVDVIRRYAGGLPPGVKRDDPSILHLHLSPTPISYWLSEPDKGQSDAFNKGFARARGRFLTWLNADDIMLPGTIEKLKAAAEKHPDCEWFTGNFIRYTQNGTLTEVAWGPHWYPQCLQRPSSPLVIFGPTSFFSKKILDQVGGMDESLHYIMDNDLWYRFMAAGIKQRRLKCFCWGFRMHEASKTAEFGEHSLDTRILAKMRAEKAYLEKKSNYHPSKLLRYILLGLRVFDGSLWRRYCCRRNLRKLGDV